VSSFFTEPSYLMFSHPLTDWEKIDHGLRKHIQSVRSAVQRFPRPSAMMAAWEAKSNLPGIVCQER
jgi:hypothetical protein